MQKLDTQVNMKIALAIPLLFLALACHVLSIPINSSTIDSKVQVEPETIEVPFGGTAKFTCNAIIYNQYPEDYSKSLAWHCFITGQTPSTIECSSQANRVLKVFGACSVKSVPDNLCELKVELVNQNFSCICSLRKLEDIGRVQVLLMPSDVDDDCKGYVHLLEIVTIVLAVILLISIIGILVYRFRHKIFNKSKLNSLAEAETQTDPEVSSDDDIERHTSDEEDGLIEDADDGQRPDDEMRDSLTSQATEERQLLLDTKQTADSLSLHSDIAVGNVSTFATEKNPVTRRKELAKYSSSSRNKNSEQNTSVKVPSKLYNIRRNAQDNVDDAGQKPQHCGIAKSSHPKQNLPGKLEQIPIYGNRLFRDPDTKESYVDFPLDSYSRALRDPLKESVEPTVFAKVSDLLVSYETKDEQQIRPASYKKSAERVPRRIHDSGIDQNQSGSFSSSEEDILNPNPDKHQNSAGVAGDDIGPNSIETGTSLEELSKLNVRPTTHEREENGCSQAEDASFTAESTKSTYSQANSAKPDSKQSLKIVVENIQKR